MSVVFNSSGQLVTLPIVPTNTLSLAVKATLGQNQVQRNVGNFYSTFDATNGCLQQQFSIGVSSSLVLPTGAAGLVISTNNGGLTLQLSKTTGTSGSPTTVTYEVYMNSLYISDDSLSGVTLLNASSTVVISGFIAYVPYTF
jgi:hypothetical protein